MVILRSLWYPLQPPIDMRGRRGCRQLWSSRAHLQKNQQSRESEPLELSRVWGCFPGPVYSGTRIPRPKFAILYMDASIVQSSYQCSRKQNVIHDNSCRCHSEKDPRTVHVEHLLLESNPKCFISHSPTYLILSIMKYHIY